MIDKNISDIGQNQFFKAVRTVATPRSGLLSRLQFRNRLKSGASFIQRHPFMSFFIALGLLLGLIVIGNVVGQPQTKTESETITPKQVEVYSIGDSPKVTVQGRVEKGSVIRINAQMSGIASSINVKEGDKVKKGANLLQLSSTYEGGNQAAIQAQIAQKQYQIASETYPLQKEAIKKQRELAEKGAKNTDELRIISERSLEDTRSVQAQNNEILTTLNQNLETLLQNNTGSAADQAAILQARQLRAQYQSSVSMLNNQVRSLEYQTDTDNPPTSLSEAQRDLALRQIDIQEKTLDISLDIAKLQRSLAYLATSLMHPTSPIEGTVESVLVTPFQQVNPGTPLFVISGNSGTTKVRVDVNREIANRVSAAEMSTLVIDQRKYEVLPYYVSTEATSGNMYTIYFVLSEDNTIDVSDGEYLDVTLPVGSAQTGTAVPFVPLDAVYQTQDSSFVYVTNGDKAEARTVTLGSVFGSYVVVEKGLQAHDTVILDRTIVDGDRVSTRL